MLQNTLHVFLARLTVAQQHNFQITTLIISAKLCFFCTHATILAPTRRAWCFSCAFYFPHHWVALWSQEALPKFVRNKGLFSLISSLKVFIESRLLRLLIAQFTYLCFCVVVMPWRQLKKKSLGHFVRRFIVTASGFIFFSSLSRKFFFHVIAGSGKNLQNTRSNYRSIIWLFTKPLISQSQCSGFLLLLIRCSWPRSGLM